MLYLSVHNYEIMKLYNIVSDEIYMYNKYL